MKSGLDSLKLIIFIFGLLIISCSKSVDTIEFDFLSSNAGELHNKLLDNVIMANNDELNGIEKPNQFLNDGFDLFLDRMAWKKDFLLSNTSLIQQLNEYSKINYNNRNYNSEVEQYMGMASSNLKLELLKLLEFVEGYNFISINEFENNLHYFINSNERSLSKLSNPEKAIMADAFSVAQNSALFWLPTQLGGYNRYYQFKNFNIIPDKNQLELRKFSWGILIGSDIAGIVEGATVSLIESGGAAALPNPLFGGVPTASVVGVAVGAFQSAIYAIQN